MQNSNNKLVSDTKYLFVNRFVSNLRMPVDSILLAVLTVSPKIQYRGILIPTTPATTGPEDKYTDNKLHHRGILEPTIPATIWSVDRYTDNK